MDPSCTRRQLLHQAGAAAAVSTLAAPAFALPKRHRVLRVAHLTDIHVEPGRGPDGFAACLEHVNNLKDKPDLILDGGDNVMDSIETEQAAVKAEWDVWQKTLAAHNTLPIVHCIGNHDVWGVNKLKSKTTGKEPLYGKRWAQESLGLKERFHSFDRGGWHFIVLDSTFHGEENYYTAKLDDLQFEWLAGDLAAAPKETPILVLSHIPILCGCAFLDGDNEKTGNWTVPGAWMHIDVRKIKDLFYKHPNVKLALSGHIHLRDRLDYNGVTYLCNGAVCGAWWGGSYQETPPGYALVDLYSDGSFEHNYVVYGEKAE